MIGSYNIAADVGVAITCSLQGGGCMKERPAGNRASREEGRRGVTNTSGK